ncbi:isovaleryl-CoA dehydrogenase [Aureimonas mangrovi]|uniref:isovaleryl-CoA dehydrogenase n=1 Tax=Aureimonas mangrovi TaxID=2758041 RepID=UPI00163D7B60|nr:isovaleryl-CoA dehydrogenase [Aureimonas mangrovi]
MTHAVFNQSPIFADIDLWGTDAPLREAVEANDAAGDDLAYFGRSRGSAQAFALGRDANTWPPRLRSFDEKGHRLDEVEFHPAWHVLMAHGMEAGLHASTWAGESHVVRGAKLYLSAQAECGHICPLTMTHASLAAISAEPELAAEWRAKILERTYDPVLRPLAEKTAVTIGMGMTENQGGTDVRANTTRAEPLAEPGLYALTGHKWFMSAPMSDAFLVLAQAPGGLTCFLLPRVLPDGRRNALHIQRLKDKLGNRSNASSEVEFAGALAHRVGEEGAGVKAIIPMVTLTRLDCALASAALMRLGLAVAIHHARHRTVFQRKLVDQPLMLAVLADLAMAVEAATALVFRLARAFDRAGSDPSEAAYARLMTPVVKYWVCKAAPAFLYEAMECLGGNGYIEDGLLARAYREAPVNAIWEGSGNVMALDLLRVLSRDRDAAGTVLSEMQDAASGDATLLDAVYALPAMLAGLTEGGARQAAERIAVTSAASLLRRHAPPAVADAFIENRLSGRAASTFTGIADPAAARTLVDRAFPPDR